MIKELIFSKTVVPVLGKGMDALAGRQKAIAQNVANAQSPGYRRKVLLFEDELRRATRHAAQARELYRTHPDHLPSRPELSRVRPRLEVADDRRDGAGSEEIVIEREMADLAKTQIQFEAEVKLTHTQLEMLKMAIRGTR